jgi:hypothetical protein
MSWSLPCHSSEMRFLPSLAQLSCLSIGIIHIVVAYHIAQQSSTAQQSTQHTARHTAQHSTIAQQQHSNSTAQHSTAYVSVPWQGGVGQQEHQFDRVGGERTKPFLPPAGPCCLTTHALGYPLLTVGWAGSHITISRISVFSLRLLKRSGCLR